MHPAVSRGSSAEGLAGRNTPQKLVLRARIVLLWAQVAGVTAIVHATGKPKRTAYPWRDRYLDPTSSLAVLLRKELFDRLAARRHGDLPSLRQGSNSTS